MHKHCFLERKEIIFEDSYEPPIDEGEELSPDEIQMVRTSHVIKINSS